LGSQFCTARWKEKGLAYLVAAVREGVGGLEEAIAAQRALTASRHPHLEVPPSGRVGPLGVGLQQSPEVWL